jgi:Fe-S cluster biogenesis protein NfuA
MSSDSSHKDRLYAEVKAALDKIRPYLEEDGGDVQIVEINDQNVVMIELLGACGTCPMSSMTMKAGVEEAIKREVPEIKSVEAINITPLEYL